MQNKLLLQHPLDHLLKYTLVSHTILELLSIMNLMRLTKVLDKPYVLRLKVEIKPSRIAKADILLLKLHNLTK